MTADTDTLIERLARDAAPVRRLRAPMQRALLWLLAAGAVGAAAILACADLGAFAARAHAPSVQLELAGTLTTGILAVVAAFHLSLPDRSPRWALAPLPPLAVWIGGTSMGCYRDWLTHRGGMWQVGESGECLAVIVGCGVPLAAALVWSLRRARPLAPIPVTVTAGIGAAAFGAFLLEFFHDLPATFMDVGLHACGVAAVVLACRFGAVRVIDA